MILIVLLFFETSDLLSGLLEGVSSYGTNIALIRTSIKETGSRRLEGVGQLPHKDVRSKFYSSGALDGATEGILDVLADLEIPSSRSNVNREKRHVAFLKVHKTGSSSVQNIFLRFGDSRNLTFILGHDDKNKSESGFPNVISYKNTLNDDIIVPPPPGKKYEILCCHLIFSRSAFTRYLPPDSVYIGIVRDPITRLESAIRYFRMFSNVNLSDFADDPLAFDKRLPSMANNRMAFEFGFPLHLFPSKSVGMSPNSFLEVTDYLRQLKEIFDLILVNEYIDESLILMKRVLNWHVKDIIYQKKLVAKPEKKRTFSENDVPKLRRYLYLDYFLYSMAVEELKKKIDKAGEGLKDEVNHFNAVIGNVTEYCESAKENESDNVLYIEASPWDTEFVVTPNDCKLYSKHEIAYIQEIRQHMFGRINI